MGGSGGGGRRWSRRWEIWSLRAASTSVAVTPRSQPGSGRGRSSACVGAAAGDGPVDGGDMQLAGSVSGNGGAVIRGGDRQRRRRRYGHDRAGVVILGHADRRPRAGAVRLDGGASGGAGVAGGGGHLFFTTSDGDLTMAGKLSLRGGDAPRSGRYRWPRRRGRHLQRRELRRYRRAPADRHDGVIDASGGAGTIGGSARNDGDGGVASFPDEMEMHRRADQLRRHARHDPKLARRTTAGSSRAAAPPTATAATSPTTGSRPTETRSPPSGYIDNAATAAAVRATSRGE